MGRKSIPILLKATSPEGETKMFTSIGEAAKELGFSERGVGTEISYFSTNQKFSLL